MRKRDPRRLLAKRRRAAARVRILSEPEDAAPRGAITSKQCAEVTLARSELERLWHREQLENLARTYWRYLTQISLGMLRVLYTPQSREIVFLTRPFVLLRFHAPEYETSAVGGTVTWRIDRGLLVAPAGRGKGYLRLTVERRPDPPEPDMAVAFVSSEVANFYPMIAGWGRFARIGRHIYRATQYRLHVIVTHGFLRSLANLELEPSVVGALRNAAAAQIESATGGAAAARANGAGRAGAGAAGGERPSRR